MGLYTDQIQQRVAFYIRVSTEDQVEKYGIDLQKTALEGLVRSKGKLNDGETDAMILAGQEYIYIDEGISGQIPPRERPAFAKLMEDIELASDGEKPFDVVFVYKIDRFARRLKVLLEVVDFLESQDIKFVSANESIDTSTPFGKAILGIVGVIAELEIETTKLRTKDGRQQAIDKGSFMGQAAPYGFSKNVEKKLELLEPEAKIVSNIFDWFVYEGLSAQQIADRLTNDQVLSPDSSGVFYGKRKGSTKKKNSPYFWRLEKVREILSDRIYLGEYWYHKSETNPKTKKVVEKPKNEWKLSKYRYSPLIEPLIFKKAEKLLEESSRRISLESKRKDNHLYLLSGLLKCADCAGTLGEGEMITWVGDRKKLNNSNNEFSFYYKCGRKNKKKYSKVCTVLPIPAQPIEEYVLNFTRELLQDPKRVFEHQQNLLSTKRELEHLNTRRARLIENLNSIPKRINNLKAQHRDGFIKTINDLKEQVSEEERKAKNFKEEIDKINDRLGRNAISQGYLSTFGEFAAKYSSILEDLYNNREEVYKLLHLLINRIIVWSRPVTEIDSIAGRKSGEQKIPWSIEIELKLPQEMIADLAESKFEVTSSNL